MRCPKCGAELERQEWADDQVPGADAYTCPACGADWAFGREPYETGGEVLDLSEHLPDGESYADIERGQYTSWSDYVGKPGILANESGDKTGDRSPETDAPGGGASSNRAQ